MEIGETSKWYPAVASLPETPPNPWLKPIRDLKELEFDDEIRETIQTERSGNELIVNQLSVLYGQILGLSVIVIFDSLSLFFRKWS